MMRQRYSTFQSRAVHVAIQFRADARSGEIYYISVACLNGFLILCAVFSVPVQNYQPASAAVRRQVKVARCTVPSFPSIVRTG